MKFVKSINPCKSLPSRQAGVVQTIYDVVEAYGGDPDSYREKVQSKEGDGAVFIVMISST